jgi:anti-sigma B factor antagonist
MTAPYFGIQEGLDGDVVSLRLTGELDMGSVPVLEQRLEQLGAENRLVALDLSELEFVDSTGIHALVEAVKASRERGAWLRVDPDLRPQVQRVLRLVALEEFLVGDGCGGR